MKTEALKEIGRIIQVRRRIAIIEITGKLEIGDYILVKASGETIRQKVKSMQINKKGVNSAKPGDAVGILMDNEVEKNSRVFKDE